MNTKLLTFVACALMAVTGVLYSAPSFATTGYYFVSVCTVPNAFECPLGPNPATFGPYATLAACNSARAVIASGPLGHYPRSLSGCYVK